MSDSTKVERLERLPKKPPKNKRERFQDLPRWVRTALTQKVTQDLTYKEAAALNGRTQSALEKYGSSPAGQRWMAQIEEVGEDPVEMARATIRASVLGVTADYMLALEMAVEANDYKEIGIIARDILDREGVTKKAASRGGGGLEGAQVIINLSGGASLEPAEVESSYEEADYEVVDE